MLLLLSLHGRACFARQTIQWYLNLVFRVRIVLVFFVLKGELRCLRSLEVLKFIYLAT